ncbi:MAG: hypothetical protein G5Z43_001143 [Caldisphaeraceae archaeon]|nr:hypothetical protein [Caldisphaeraceae archaeon]
MTILNSIDIFIEVFVDGVLEPGNDFVAGAVLRWSAEEVEDPISRDNI